MQFGSTERKRISLEAAIWLLLLAEFPSPEQRAAFAAWLTKSRLHVEIFLYMAVRFPQLSIPGTVPERGTRKLRSHAPVRIVPHRDRPAHIGHRPAVWGSIACGLAVVAVAVYFAWTRFDVPAIVHEREILYTTAGVVKLGDASTMTLDVKSRASVRLSSNPSGAQVHLLEGHALFEGVHDRNNFLRVASGNMVIDVLGTAFDVYHDQSGTTVKVGEGQVRVTSNCNSTVGSSADQSLSQSGLAGPATVLYDGQMATAASDTCGGPLEIRVAEGASVHQQVISDPDWLDFKDTTVREAVRQFNRYNANARRIVVSDSILASQHIGGRFHPSDMDTFLKVLALNYSARVIRRTSPDGSQVIYLVPAKGR